MTQNLEGFRDWIEKHKDEFYRPVGFHRDILYAEINSTKDLLWLMLNGNGLGRGNWAYPEQTNQDTNTLNAEANVQWANLKKKLITWNVGYRDKTQLEARQAEKHDEWYR